MSNEPRNRLSVPAATGQLSVAQGAYGERGNLELAYPDPVRGLWVCWYNNDPLGLPGTATFSVVPPGTWSSGLRFGHKRYTAVSLIQATLGPNFLEAVAATDKALHRWTWSPDRGFEHTDTLMGLSDLPLDDCAVGEADNGLVACARSGDEALVWRAEASRYPTLAWGRPARIQLPTETSMLVARVTSHGAVNAAVVTPKGLRVSEDIVSEGWRGLPRLTGEATAAAWVRGSTDVEDEPSMVVSAGGALLAASLRGDVVPVPLVPAPAADAVAATWSRTDRSRLEVVARTGTDLTHDRVVDVSPTRAPPETG